MFLSRCSAILFVMCLSIGEISSQVRIRYVLDYFHNLLSLFFSFFLYDSWENISFLNALIEVVKNFTEKFICSSIGEGGGGG